MGSKAVSGATLQGGWKSVLFINGWDYTSATFTTASTGSGTIKATKTIPTAKGNGCTFTVTSLTHPSYTWDPAPSTMKTKTLTW